MPTNEKEPVAGSMRENASPPQLAGASLVERPPSEGDLGFQPRLPGPSEGNVKGDDESVAAFAAHVHGYVNNYITFADQKAAFVFAAATALLSYLNSQGGTVAWLKPPIAWSLLDTLACISSMGLLTAVICSLATILPRFHATRTGIVYWKSIAALSGPEEYLQRVPRQDRRALDDALLEHIFDLSRICCRKYRPLNVGILAGSVGLAAGVLFVAFR